MEGKGFDCVTDNESKGFVMPTVQSAASEATYATRRHRKTMSTGVHARFIGAAACYAAEGLQCLPGRA